MAASKAARFICVLIVVNLVVPKGGRPTVTNATWEKFRGKTSDGSCRTKQTKLLNELQLQEALGLRLDRTLSVKLLWRSIALAILLLTAGDIELNPGPECNSCGETVQSNVSSLTSGTCFKPIHNQCGYVISDRIGKFCKGCF